MQCFVFAATDERAGRLAGMLLAQGFEPRVATAPSSAAAELARSAIAEPALAPTLVFVDLDLGIEGLRALLAPLFAVPPPLRAFVALVGVPASDAEVDALLAAGVSVCCGDAAPSFAVRARFLRHAVNARFENFAQAREREAHYRTIVKALDEGLVVQNAAGEVVTTNPSAAEILGVDEASVREKTWRSWRITSADGARVPPEDLPSVRAMRTGEPVHGCLLRLERPDGTFVWLCANSHLVRASPAAAPTAVVTTFSDATAAQRADDDHLALLGRAPDAVLIHRGGRTVWANARCVELLGYDDASELVGVSILDITSAGYRAVTEQRMSARAAGADVPPMELTVKRRDGVEVHAAVMGVPILFRGAPAILVFGRDLTRQRKLELQLMSADRLAALGRLAAGVGHEVNNPLAYVIANLRSAADALAGRSGDDAHAAELVDGALEGAERIRRIVGDLKVFAAPGSEDLAPLDVHRVIDSCARMAANEIRHRASLVRDFGAVPPVFATEARLAQVLLNLLINAAQATPEGNASAHTITIATRLEADGRVAVRVTDTGVGISAEDLPRVRTPFFTTKRSGGGMGLGLSISQMLVAAQGGELDLASEIGKGTTVTVRLAPAERLAPAVVDRRARHVERKLKILVVDDEAPLARIIGLELGAHDVTLASSGREAIRHIEAGRAFDAIVCDLIMPDLGGVDVYERARALAPGLERRIVFMTGGAFTSRTAGFVADSGNACLEKPFAMLELVSAIRRAVDA
jgi:PAS domain S-box-containing protein